MTPNEAPPSDKLSTSMLAMFTFVVWITACEAVAIAIASAAFDLSGTAKTWLGLAVFAAAATAAGMAILKRIEQRAAASLG